MPRNVPELRTGEARDRLNAVSERVRQRRKELGLTMEALCVAIEEATDGAWNPDRRDIYRIQEATRKITDLELVALARSLKVAPADLLPADIPIYRRAPDEPRIRRRRDVSPAPLSQPDRE